jgi:hypothetical protein
MRTNKDILTEAYIRLAKKVGTWVGLAAIIATTLVATPASAQVSNRKAQMSDPTPGASSVTYDINFTWTASTTGANAVKGVRFQFCSNSPLYNTSCTALGGTFVRGTGVSTQTDNTVTFGNTYSGATSGTTDVLYTNATGNTFTNAHNYRFVITGFTNINTTNTEFYVRAVICNDVTCTVGAGSNLDDGGFAVDTSQTLSVSASVQEDLTFCVGVTVTTPCSVVGTGTVPLAPNPMTTSAISDATAKMAVSTNASSGYVVTYAATTFTDTTSDTITAAASGGVAPGTGGTEQFGFTLANQTSGALNGVCAAPSGGSGTATSPYSVNNQIAYNTAGGTQVASAASATAFTTYTICYGANVAATTKPGVYTATQTFLATGTF